MRWTRTWGWPCWDQLGWDESSARDRQKGRLASRDNALDLRRQLREHHEAQCQQNRLPSMPSCTLLHPHRVCTERCIAGCTSQIAPAAAQTDASLASQDLHLGCRTSQAPQQACTMSPASGMISTVLSRGVPSSAGPGELQHRALGRGLIVPSLGGDIIAAGRGGGRIGGDAVVEHLQGNRHHRALPLQADERSAQVPAQQHTSLALLMWLLPQSVMEAERTQAARDMLYMLTAALGPR